MTYDAERRTTLLLERSSGVLDVCRRTAFELGLDLVGWSDPKELFDLAEERSPALVVMGLYSAGDAEERIAVITLARERVPDLQVIVLSESEDAAQIAAVIAAGASACVVATSDWEDLASALRLALERSIRAAAYPKEMQGRLQHLDW